MAERKGLQKQGCSCGCLRGCYPKILTRFLSTPPHPHNTELAQQEVVSIIFTTDQLRDAVDWEKLRKLREERSSDLLANTESHQGLSALDNFTRGVERLIDRYSSPDLEDVILPDDEHWHIGTWQNRASEVIKELSVIRFVHERTPEIDREFFTVNVTRERIINLESVPITYGQVTRLLEAFVKPEDGGIAISSLNRQYRAACGIFFESLKPAS